MGKNTPLILLTMLVMISCSQNKAPGSYTVTKIAAPVEINGNWEKEPWKDISPLLVNHPMGNVPDHKPKVQAKMAYDDAAIYVIFLIEDQYVRCIMENYQDPVSKDSAVEFFFTPGTDISRGYFNLETNCGGTGLFKFQKEAKKDQIKIPEATFKKIDMAHSLPRIVDPEIQEKVTWTIEYRIPIDILTSYYGEVTPPAPGIEWKANFYKIGSDTSHPHWLTWAVVDHPVPHFHLPEFFGTLQFE